MPTIHFLKADKKSIAVEKGVELMSALLKNGIPVASSCHGDGVCGKCIVQVMQGKENLSAINENETVLLAKNQKALNGNFRISCQVKVMGDVTLDTGYW